MRRHQEKKELGELLDHGSEEIKPNHSFHGPYKASGVLRKWPSTARSLSDAQLEKKQGCHRAAEDLRVWLLPGQSFSIYF